MISQLIQSFKGVNRLFVLSLEDNDGKRSYKRYYFPLVEKKNYNAVIGRRSFFD